MQPRADALHFAKNELAKLQAQMTRLNAKMAATIETLLTTVPLKEARQFLRVECGVPTADLKVFARMAALPDDPRAILENQSVPFTVAQGATFV